MMIEFAIAGLTFFFLLIGTIDVANVLWGYIDMSRAVHAVARCSAMDAHSTDCPNITTYANTYLFNSVDIKIEVSSACVGLYGVGLSQITGTLSYKPFIVTALAKNYTQTLCFTRQY